MRIHHIAVISLLALAAGCRTPAPALADAHPPTATLVTADPAPAGIANAPGHDAVPASAAPSSATDAGAGDARLARLSALAPDADRGVLALALAARECAVDSGEVAPDSRLAVIDYSLPSTTRRLWVFDVQAGKLLHHELVAHGRGSGDNYATSFSNAADSHQTSLGLFRTAETYVGGNGYSMRLDGLEPGVNDNARARAIVMHGAWYVDPAVVAQQGRLGRSYGCPALRQQVARVVIDELKDRNLLFSYADNAAWLQRSRDFACSGRSARQIVADARRAGGGTSATAVAMR
ncbi:MAG TPA: murein L,D-transpeptidase catalytic domain family protein [Luteimonas sp.]|nr:murein L,D-transpeptidase catalytic domain family protein [Luteimonas sp.]